MQGFIVFEFAPPIQWKPVYEHEYGSRYYRIVWLLFSITFVRNMNWTSFIAPLLEDQDDNDPERPLWI